MSKKNKWTPIQRQEMEYKQALQSVNYFIKKQISNTNDPKKIVSVLKKISNMPYFKNYCKKASTQMVTGIYMSNTKSWRVAARSSIKGKEIYNTLLNQLKDETIGEIIVNQIMQNAELIKSIPLELAEDITNYVQLQTEGGKRSSTISQELKTVLSDKTEARITLISRTEVSKSQSIITRARAENVGIEWYIWRTSEDSRVRSSHDIMDGVLVRWNDPPNPEKLNGEKRDYGKYHSGNIFNCRCYSEPVISWDYVKFPCKVHFSGKIEKMTKQKFMQKFNI